MEKPFNVKRFLVLLTVAAIVLTALTVVWVRTGFLSELVREAEPADPPAGFNNDERELMQKFSGETRQLYNNRRFAELETLADRLRSSKEQFRSGAWKLVHAYNSLDCRDEEPENMWQLHETIYQEWETAFPQSATARVSHAQFMVEYAWHARGSDYADKVTEEGWRLFRERLATARKILDESKSLSPCPVWWSVRLKVALGQGEDRPDYEALFQEAKRAEPRFFYHDLSLAYYLLPRWHGKPGDWEAAAEKEIERPDGLGYESYTRVVIEQAGYYDDVFKETNASWRKTKKGFDDMRDRYSDSEQILNVYCRLACFAGDREQARKLFALIGDTPTSGCWRKKNNEFRRAKIWAMSEK